jgi:hypothetical protein
MFTAAGLLDSHWIIQRTRQSTIVTLDVSCFGLLVCDTEWCARGLLVFTNGVLQPWWQREYIVLWNSCNHIYSRPHQVITEKW